MTGFHNDILKLIAKSTRLQSNHQQKQPIIHIKINLDKCYQLFEHEDWSGIVSHRSYSNSHITINSP